MKTFHDDTLKMFEEKFEPRFIDIARMADEGNDRGYGHGLARLQIEIKSFLTSRHLALTTLLVERMRDIVSKHNAKILNQFQLQGTPNMPMSAYDERVCLVPAMEIITVETNSDIIALIKEV